MVGLEVLSLILFSSAVDYMVGNGLMNSKGNSRRKLLLVLSVLVNIGFLGFFKYYNFFIKSFVDAFSFFGQKINARSMSIVLPVGISFYTFQTLSYSIDVYKRKIEPTKNVFAFFAFVCFFPQLVAGPIERASNLLPQFYDKRRFDFNLAKDGLRQMLWGFFKKVVIADNCAEYVNNTFSNYENLDGSSLLLGAFLFSFQIYGDFSGYSDIAIGSSKLFGFNLRQNFAFPYFSRNIAEFWKRWHISLSTWFRDYVYIPLGGSNVSQQKKIRNVFIVFVISGFWHGASWNFVIWGLVNAILFIPLLLFNKNRMFLKSIPDEKIVVGFKDFIRITSTFFVTMLAWVFFRSDSVLDAMGYLNKIFSVSLFSSPVGINSTISRTFVFIGLMIVVEWFQRNKLHGLEFLELKVPLFFRWPFYYFLILMIIVFGGNQQDFIYFQF